MPEFTIKSLVCVSTREQGLQWHMQLFRFPLSSVITVKWDVHLPTLNHPHYHRTGKCPLSRESNVVYIWMATHCWWLNSSGHWGWADKGLLLKQQSQLILICLIPVHILQDIVHVKPLQKIHITKLTDSWFLALCRSITWATPWHQSWKICGQKEKSHTSSLCLLVSYQQIWFCHYPYFY